MGRTLTRFKQHLVTTTRPMNCYAVSTRLRRSGHHLWMYPLHHGQNPYKIQTAPGYYYKTDELLRCFNKTTTLQTFFSFSPIRTWTAVRDQESVNQESVNQEFSGQDVKAALDVSIQACVLVSHLSRKRLNMRPQSTQILVEKAWYHCNVTSRCTVMTGKRHNVRCELKFNILSRLWRVTSCANSAVPTLRPSVVDPFSPVSLNHHLASSQMLSDSSIIVQLSSFHPIE
ncbi:hypothetical protein TNCV_1562781 [Trichonephila clavipes]|nr:hypothetical protein TNCV_1562781 [Trichonephila clavipes]